MKIKMKISKEVIDFVYSISDVYIDRECGCNRCYRDLNAIPVKIKTMYLNNSKITTIPHEEDMYDVEDSDYWVRSRGMLISVKDFV